MALGAAGGPQQEGRVSFLPGRGRKSSVDFLPAPRARLSPPPGAQGKGVCVKVETLNKCCGKFPHFYSERNELSFFQPCVQVAVLSLGTHVHVENSLRFPVICLLDTAGTSVCGLKYFLCRD